MTKFWGRDDPNYLKVGGELKKVMAALPECIQAAQTVPPTRSTHIAAPSPSISASVSLPQDVRSTSKLSQQELACLKTLSFTGMASRQQTIQEAQIDTCRWFLDSNIFKCWHSRADVKVDAGLLWVKGKPGSGKSTIMKHTVHWMERTEHNHATVAAFYFNARGEYLEKTPLGLFRSILHQICVQDSTVRAEFLSLYEERLRKTTPGDEWSWAELELQAFMRRIFRDCKPRRSFLFIDALEECELQTVREVVYFLAKVAKSAVESGLCLNICLSSRHYPTISVPNCLEIVVETGNGPDIAAYIRDRFSFAPSSEASSVAKLQSTITEKAAGVFLWVVLVVDHLLRDIDSGQSMSKLAERLKQVPRTMEELYTERCRSLSTEERDFSVPLIQWVLFGDESFKRHGFPEAAVLAAHFSASGVQLQNAVGDNISPKHERTVRRIKDASRGLIEYNTADKKVQFIHETAREFFLTGPGLGLLDPRLAENPTGLSYMALVNGCLNAIEASQEPSRVQYWFHWFAGHTRSSVIHYARMVERHGGSNIVLLESIKAGRYCALEGIKNYRYGQLKPGESFLRYLSRVGLTSCALDLLKQGLHPDDSGDSYASPLACLFSAEHRSALGRPDNALVQGLVKYGANLECQSDGGKTPLLVAVSCGWVEIAEFLIISGADVKATDLYGFNVLDYTAHLRQL
ncbi:hypothetical protein C8A01DRAFT_39872 [Parachaetomium inaequale]|uniref:Nephrocystin 3-like N-terminal domain-containing protein n=1 Tax=Parachaetomium inaequale TaxID=2588326 RepID=A0AAN6PA90_9PEZI|nr:hypothetical protein C8A01DRAFT_39872 [Parachaetomium inaequale]